MPTTRRRVRIEQTEVYRLEVDTYDDPGTDAVIALDELDEDDTAAAYDFRTLKVYDDETGEELPVDENEV